MMKLLRTAFFPLLAGMLLLPAAALPLRAADSAVAEAGVKDKKRDKNKKRSQAADTVGRDVSYEKLFKDKKT